MNLSGIILAAGQGTRMKSELPKVLHDVCGLPIVMHVSRAFAQAGIERPVVVVGNKHEMVMQAMGQAVEFAYQEKQLGTGAGVICRKTLPAPRLGMRNTGPEIPGRSVHVPGIP